MSNRINLSKDFDVVSEVLETLRFKGTIFFKSELAAPWGMYLDTTSYPRFHIAIKGGFVLGMKNTDNLISIKEMEVLMLPLGDAHWIADKPGRNLISSEEAGKACELGKPFFQIGEITTHLLCGMIQYDEQAAHPLLSSFSDIIHIPHNEISPAVWQLVKLIESEISSEVAKRSALVDRLTEALFLKLLQEKVLHNKESEGFIAALNDRRLSVALQILHEHLQQNWTLQELADEVGMSRATLVRHFRETVGLAPMEYLTHWRLTKALSYIKYTSYKLERIAEMIGFSSAQSLSKAFKKKYNASPMSVRK